MAASGAAEFTLYGVAVSAFVARVRVVLDLKGLAYAELPPPGGYGSAAYRAIIASGTVPGLVHGGRAFSESTAIAEYLDEIAPEPPLMPVEPAARARVRMIAAFHDGRVEAAARAMFPLVKRGWRAEPEALQDGIAGMEAALERLAGMVEGPYAAGSRLTLADVAYPATLQMATMMADEMRAPLAVPPLLAGWLARLADVPAIARSLGITRAAMEEWLAGFRRG
jgi:glutathione S-transferase